MLDKIIRVFKKKHPDIYEALKKYAEERGVKVSDVIGSAVLSYLSADEEGKEKLEKMVAEKSYMPMGKGSFKAFLDMFKETANAMVDMMVSIQEAGQKLVRGSLINELRGNIETIEEIKKIGSSSGTGSIEDLFARAFIDNLLSRVGVSKPPETKKSGTGKVVEVKEEE